MPVITDYWAFFITVLLEYINTIGNFLYLSILFTYKKNLYME